MYLLAPLKRPPIALFWGGQVLSGVGDELRRVALVWIAIGLIGKDAAFISAAQAATMMVLSLWSGIYADRWDQRRTMIAVDLIRAVIALALAVAAGMEKLGVWAIFGATIAVAGLNSLYMPTVQASLGRLITGPDMMHALNGLMDGTRRLARVIGPALVGILALLVPIHHFFTINGATFLTAGLAALVLRHHLHRPPPPAGTPPRPAGFRFELMEGVTGVARHGQIRYAFVLMFVSTGAWATAFQLCLPLHVQDVLKEDIGYFGLILSAYGVGNLTTIIWLASRPMARPGRVLVVGRFIMAAGLIGLAFAPNLPFLMLAAAVTAMAGPMTDLPYLVLIRRDFPADMIGRLYSVRNTVDSAGMLTGMLIAPVMLSYLSIGTTIVAVGVMVALFGVAGFRQFNR